jgi:hypothetical protein
MSKHGAHARKKIQSRGGPTGGVVAALVSVVVLGLTASVALGVTPFYAQVGGTGNSFQSGTLLLSKTVGGTTCLSSLNSAAGISTNVNSACAGSDLGSGTTNEVSGTPQTGSVTLTNQGSIASATGIALTEASCTAAAAPFGTSALNPLSSGSDTAGFCGKVDVTLFNGTKCVYPGGAGACPALSNTYNLSTLASAGSLNLVSSLTAGTSVTLTYSTALDSTATNADQGLAASIPLTYTLTQ